MITRKILNKDIDYDGFKYYEICDLIDSWKYLLFTKGARRGHTLALSIAVVNVNQIALIFAAGELGLQLFIIDWPISPYTLHKTKMGLFGPVDFTIECEELGSFDIHRQMVRKYSHCVIAENEINFVPKRIPRIPSVSRDNDPFLISSTSGTTGEAKPVVFTQEQIYIMSKRNIDIFKFYKDSRVGHTKNMHHASSLITDLIPSLMASDYHRSCLYSVLNPKSFEQNVVPTIKKYKLDRILIYNTFSMFKFLDALGKDNSFPILINMSGFTVPKNFIEICKEYNIEILSHYGSIDTGIPLLVNHVTKDSKFIPNSLGILPDNFNKFEIDDEIYVESPVWKGKRTLQDNIEFTGEVWIHLGRKNRNPLEEIVKNKFTGDFTIVHDNDKVYLALWDDNKIPENFKILFDQIDRLNKEKFTPETKVHVDQLRGYFQYQSNNNREIFSVGLKFNRVNDKGELPWLKVDQDKLFKLLRSAYHKYDVDHIPLTEEQDPVNACITVASCNKNSLRDFLENEGTVLFEMEELLRQDGFNPKIVYNEIYAVS